MSEAHVLTIRGVGYTKRGVMGLIKQTLLEFLTSLSEIVPPSKMSVLLFVSCYIKNQPVERIFGVCEKNLLPHKMAIRTQNEDFVTQNLYTLFGDLPPSEVKFVKDMWQSGELDERCKQTAWDFVSVLLALTQGASGKEH